MDKWPLLHDLRQQLSAQLDVLRLIAKGYANQEIAAELVISVPTVKKHVNHIFAKLGGASRAQAIVAAQTRHLA